jgi:pyruvate carboxylase subunit B
MVLGYFGKTPVPPDAEIVRLASEQLGLEPTTRNPRDINDEDPSKGIEAARSLLVARNLEVTDESIFIASALKEKGLAFLEGERPDGVRKVSTAPESKSSPSGSGSVGQAANAYTVALNGRRYEVAFEGGQARVNGKTYDYSIQESHAGASSTASSTALSGSGAAVCAELAGQVLRLGVHEGDAVSEGDLLLVLEALKMEIEIKAPGAGVVGAVLVSVDQMVKPGDALVEIHS